MKLKVAAERPGQYLLVDHETFNPKDPRAEGQIYDNERGTLFPMQNFHSIVARGYWEPHSGDFRETTIDPEQLKHELARTGVRGDG